MRATPPNTESYLLHGCGRCSLFDTPDCKVHIWQDELRMLLAIVRSHNLEESIKWSVPVFSVNGKNLLSVTAFKPHASLSFFSGASLSDKHSLLVMPGQNSASARVFRCTDTATITKHERALHALIDEAIALESNGPAKRAANAAAATARASVSVPAEFTEIMAADAAYAAAFARLTPGRQRGYMLHFGSAKQSATRAQRIAKARARVMDGKGMQDA